MTHAITPAAAHEESHEAAAGIGLGLRPPFYGDAITGNIAVDQVK
ncbi:MAG: hypothetical protein V3R65_01790 [Acidiferrobacterales bacterium]